MPPPLLFAVKVTDGSAGEQAPNVAVGVGMPFDAKANVLACVGMKMTLLALVMAGARVLPMVTVAMAESTEPSLTLKVKLSLAVASALGVYVRFGAVPVNTPCVGWVTTVKVSGEASKSEPVSVMERGVPTMAVTVCALATGGELSKTSTRKNTLPFSTVL